MCSEVPVFVAGGIGRGEAILAYLEMGAAGAQLGTRFAAVRRKHRPPRFKHAFIHARARDALPSVQLDPSFPVIPVRALANAGTERFLQHQARGPRARRGGELTREQAQLLIEHFWAGALRRAVIDGDVEHRLRHGRAVRRHGRRRAARGRDHRRTRCTGRPPPCMRAAPAHPRPLQA